MKILSVGDVVAKPGLAFLRNNLPLLRERYHPDLVIVNGENADLIGIRPEQAREIRDSGADVITLGNHVWNRREISPLLDEEPWLLRPHNLAPELPGTGAHVFTAGDGSRVCVVNLLGRIFLDFRTRDPLEVMEKVLRDFSADYYIVDFHADATSEKFSFGWCFDGRVGAVFGTHTHVQTADEQILPRGTGFITDIGMTGPRISSLGTDPGQAVMFFKGALTERFKPANGPCILGGAVFDLENGLCKSVERVLIKE